MEKTKFLSSHENNVKCALCEYSKHCPIRYSSNSQTYYIGARAVRCEKDQRVYISNSLKRRLP